jgi:glucuronoarabinoxylan endo-1,4-beta-xylanase
MKMTFAVVVLAAGLSGFGIASQAQTCIVDGNNVHQRIDGFGASSAWQSSWNPTEASIFFSTNNGIIYFDTIGNKTTNNGIGLSLLRNHIAYATTPASTATPTTVETTIMQDAQALGAKVWSTPWTPAAGFKSTNDIYDSRVATGGGINGGSYLGNGNNATNLAYASQLANYVRSMKITYGVILYAISIQNEPDAAVTSYEACQWSSAQIHDFTTNLFNALSTAGVGSTKIILPESQNWQDPHGLGSSALTDPNVAADVGIVADHNYDGANGPMLLAKNSYGKALWETEVSILSGSDGSITNGVYYAQRIHLFMTVAQANAYHYWWLMASTSSTGNQGLMDNNGSITKRLFAFGQFSRFVRPGYYRIDATNTSSALISAYQNPTNGNFAIVAINTNTTMAISQTFTLTNVSASSVTPWMTTSNLSLASQIPVAVSGSSFTYTLPALSVVTFVGHQSANTPPTLQPVANQVIDAGMTLVVTNVAGDTDQPPPTLTFSLLAGPGNLNASNGVFSWRPPVAAANTTNPVSVVVNNNGSPNLSATNNFRVIVNPLGPVTVSSITAGARQVSLLVDGPSGPDYTLLGSTNLMNWIVLFTTNSPVLPVMLNDGGLSTNSEGYYRIQIGP